MTHDDKRFGVSPALWTLLIERLEQRARWARTAQHEGNRAFITELDAKLFDEAAAELASLRASLTRAEADTAEACAKLCDHNAEAWAREAGAARGRGQDPLIYDAQCREATVLAGVIRDTYGLSRANDAEGEAR